MNKLDRRALASVWALIGVVLAAGWAGYGLVDGGRVYLAVMVVASILLGGGWSVVHRHLVAQQ